MHCHTHRIQEGEREREEGGRGERSRRASRPSHVPSLAHDDTARGSPAKVRLPRLRRDGEGGEEEMVGNRSEDD